MARNDIETDILLSRLCAKVIKTRSNRDGAEAREGGYIITGRWVNKEYRITIIKEL